jgi:hypothetical protein
LAGRKDDSCYWDYVITDEGHQLKNPNTEQHKAIARVARSPRTHRLLLTGESSYDLCLRFQKIYIHLDYSSNSHIVVYVQELLSKTT